MIKLAIVPVPGSHLPSLSLFTFKPPISPSHRHPPDSRERERESTSRSFEFSPTSVHQRSDILSLIKKKTSRGKFLQASSTYFYPSSFSPLLQKAVRQQKSPTSSISSLSILTYLPYLSFFLIQLSSPS